MEEVKTTYKDFLQPRDAWDALSMKEKAEMIGVAVRNGITNLNDIRDRYNEFAEGGSKEEVVNTDKQYLTTMEKVAEDNHQKWGFPNPDEALLHALNDNTYNYRGYYNKYPHSKANADTHWTDEFKTVYHPTFSNESIYSGQKSQYNPLGLPGGFWSGDTFVPMAWQLGVNEYKKGGSIHIAPSKKGTFTAAAKKHGKSVQAFASQVLAHPENYSPAMRKKANFARNAAKWHGLGGNLFAPGGDITYSYPFYSYDENGQRVDNTLNYNGFIPEVTIIPDSQKSPAQRMEDERYRQRTQKNYDELRDKEYIERQVAKSQKEWDNSLEKAVLDYGQAAATGIGMGADIVSGFPVYSALKGASVLSRAENPIDYIEGGLWFTPLLGTATTKAYKGIQHLYNNIQDLQSLKEFNTKYGYTAIKPKTTLIFDDASMDRVFDHTVKRHNTFVRGVDPYEAQKFGRLTDMTPEEAAKYSMTHIPKVYKGNNAGLLEGENGLYVSNDFPTAAGYANEGSGYVGIVRRPIKYGQPTRRQFLEENDFIFSRPPGKARALYTTTDEPNIPWVTKDWNASDSQIADWGKKQLFEVRANVGSRVIERGDPDFRHYIFVGNVGEEPVEFIEMFKPKTYGTKSHKGIGAVGLSRKKKFGGNIDYI